MWNAPCLIVSRWEIPSALLCSSTAFINEAYKQTFIIFLKFLFSFISSVQSLSCVRLFATPWTGAHQAPLSFMISWSLLKFMSTESVMPSNHLILCPLPLLTSIFPTIRVFSNESPLHISQSVQSLSRVQLFATPWTAARQASLSITNSWSLLKLMSIALVMPSKHLILCTQVLLSPSIFPSIRVFSNESALHFKRPKYWSFSLSPSSEYSVLISFRIDWFDLLAVQETLKSLL